MGNHPKKVEGYEGTLKELAIAIGNMHYDKTAEFIEELEKDLIRQAKGDRGRDRPKLAGELESAAVKLNNVKESLDKAWNICKQFMGG